MSLQAGWPESIRRDTERKRTLSTTERPSMPVRKAAPCCSAWRPGRVCTRGLCPCLWMCAFPVACLAPASHCRLRPAFCAWLPGDGSSRGQRDKGLCPWGLHKAPASEAGRIVAVKKEDSGRRFPVAGRRAVTVPCSVSSAACPSLQAGPQDQPRARSPDGVRAWPVPA